MEIQREERREAMESEGEKEGMHLKGGGGKRGRLEKGGTEGKRYWERKEEWSRLREDEEKFGSRCGRLGRKDHLRVY